MNKNRMEAFSDGVIAVIITIMVLELKPPHGADFAAIQSLGPAFLSYVLSFMIIAIYWNNHHHLMAAAQRVTGPILWANLHLLFWLSLVPFLTAWLAEYKFAPWPVALYGAALLLSGIAYYILAHALASHHGKNSPLAIALGKDFKGIISVVVYALAIPLSFINSRASYALYAAVALMWLVPDRRIEKVLTK